MTLTAPARRAAAVLAAGLFAGSAAAAAPPPENHCPSLGLQTGGEAHEDAAPTLVREGMLLAYENILNLRELLPVEIWRNREQFFFEGMQMTIGPCHRRYPVPSFFADATREFAGRARVDADGNLERYVAGLPFPPETLNPEDPGAGTRWAWNLQLRYRGAGPIGRFRLTDMSGDDDSDQTFLGSFFYIQTGHRADQAANEYAIAEAGDNDFVAGGRFDEPFNARHLAWKQQRPAKAREKYTRSDDTFVYVPTMRKVRRAPTTWVDGVYTPLYRAGGDTGGGGMPLIESEYTATGSISPTAGASIATSEHIRQGFSDLALRPNAYFWRVLGEREVLAPINSAHPGYPLNPDKNFGPSGLSVANDRWDVRWAVVLEGATRQRGGMFDKIVIYVDWQTQVPLYIMTKRRDNRLVEVGIPVHRFSGDVFNYPLWPSGERAFVFDPVAAVYFGAGMGRSGWRRESYGVKSVPVYDAELMRYLSPDYLLRGR